MVLHEQFMGSCEDSYGWLVAWGPCECMLVRSSRVWLLPFTLL